MELKYIKTGDYELPNLTLNDNKKGIIRTLKYLYPLLVL